MKTVAVLSTSIPVGEKDIDGVVERGVSRARLPNSEIVANLEVHLSYLESSHRSDVIEGICKYPALFSDVPTCTNVLQHDIDVGDAAPIRQHPYRANPEKHQLMSKEVDCMLQHGMRSHTSILY